MNFKETSLKKNIHQDSIPESVQSSVDMHPFDIKDRGVDLLTAKESDDARSEKMISKVLEEIKRGQDSASLSEENLNINEIKSRTVENVNFALNINDYANGVQVYIRDADGKCASLCDYLPAKYKFKKGPNFSANHHTKTVEIKNLENPSVLLMSIFHELGHAHRDVKMEKMLLGKITDTFVELFAGLEAQFGYLIKNKKLYNENLPIVKHLGDRDYSDDPEYTPRWYKEFELKKRAASERDAWAYALKNLRKLEKQGLDVFSGFKDNKEIFYYINYCLSTYEAYRAYILDKIMDDDKKYSEYVNSDAFDTVFIRSKSKP